MRWRGNGAHFFLLISELRNTLLKSFANYVNLSSSFSHFSFKTPSNRGGRTQLPVFSAPFRGGVETPRALGTNKSNTIKNLGPHGWVTPTKMVRSTRMTELLNEWSQRGFWQQAECLFRQVELIFTYIQGMWTCIETIYCWRKCN